MDLLKQRQEREWRCGPYLAVSEQRREVEEEGLAKRNRLNWVVEVFTFIKLYLESRNKARWTFELKHNKPFVSDSSGELISWGERIFGRTSERETILPRQATCNTLLDHPRLPLHDMQRNARLKQILTTYVNTQKGRW